MAINHAYPPGDSSRAATQVCVAPPIVRDATGKVRPTVCVVRIEVVPSEDDYAVNVRATISENTEPQLTVAEGS